MSSCPQTPSLGLCLTRGPPTRPSLCTGGQQTRRTTRAWSARPWSARRKQISRSTYRKSGSERLSELPKWHRWSVWNWTRTYMCLHRSGPGISSYASNPAQAGESLQGCLEEALALIPEAQQRKTPLFLGATAGMRLLSQKNSSQARDIFAAVTQVLGKSPLDFWGAELLAGQDEGALGWITINYVLGMLVKYSFSGEWIQPLEGTLVGALDMGGASTQITFVPGGPILDKSTQTTFRLYGSEHSVYTHSYLCFGRDQMLSRLLAQLVQLRPPGPPPMLPQRLLGHAVPGRPLRVPLCAHSSPCRAGREPHCGRDREPRGLYLSHPGPLQLLQLPGPRTLCLQWGLPAPCAGPVLCLLELLLHLPLPESHLQAATGHCQRHHLGVLPEALEAGGGQLARAGPLAS
ncbi:ectonucleoside triphosphate diphosphohydrolase 8 isoform X5 [Acinonyx jubatus]|uniref:Ectonucleoside triphosphate diphosphohydrolase 8 n=1 Tax=Acinonyx jubatus TaxID=32536 RepID=A0ABM3NLH5_ACIJB|nr:ectonucleoside triphosphate diphosphohydrolase 8 isoform X5 [Acinonyx jubatus]